MISKQIDLRLIRQKGIIKPRQLLPRIFLGLKYMNFSKHFKFKSCILVELLSQFSINLTAISDRFKVILIALNNDLKLLSIIFVCY